MARIVVFLAALALVVSPALGDIVVLKEGGLLAGSVGVTDPVFDLVTVADVLEVAVNDTAFHDNHADNNNYGNLDLYTTGHDDKLFQFDLASLPGFVGGTVLKAELRLRETVGNNFAQIAPVTTHAWTEALAVRNSPLGNFANEWGPLSDSEFGPADAGPLVGMTIGPYEAGIFGDYEAWIVGDVTADLQAIADGTAPDLGWYVYTPNRSFVASENAADAFRPALFLDFTPAPEPMTLSLLALGGLAALRRRR